MPTATAVLVAGIRRHSGHDDEAAYPPGAQSRCPDDFWINLNFPPAYVTFAPLDTTRRCSWAQQLALRPQSPHVRLLLGITLCRLGRTGEAVDACREAVRLEPAFSGKPISTSVEWLGCQTRPSTLMPQAPQPAAGLRGGSLNLGKVLMDKGLLDEAADRTRECSDRPELLGRVPQQPWAAIHRKTTEGGIGRVQSGHSRAPTTRRPHSNLGDILEDGQQL